MKAVWFSWILLFALLVFVFTNASYIQKTSAELSDLIEQMQNEEVKEEAISQLEKAWKKHRNRIGFSVGFRELDHFDEVLSNLRWAHQVGDQAEFERHRLLLLDAIEELERAERSDWKCLF